jgi:hypothetical protein
MAEIVNLRQARKAKAREDKQEQAAANRAKFGRTKAERELEAARKSLADKALERHKRED